jgi:hypothetical protein
LLGRGLGHLGNCRWNNKSVSIVQKNINNNQSEETL